MPTAEQQQQKNKPVEPRFKIDHAASPMPETKQPERLAPRARSNRNGGRDHLGILGEIKSVHPGEIVGIGNSVHGPVLDKNQARDRPPFDARWPSLHLNVALYCQPQTKLSGNEQCAAFASTPSKLNLSGLCSPSA
jgi:hypothetical protein